MTLKHHNLVAIISCINTNWKALKNWIHLSTWVLIDLASKVLNGKWIAKVNFFGFANTVINIVIYICRFWWQFLKFAKASSKWQIAQCLKFLRVVVRGWKLKQEMEALRKRCINEDRQANVRPPKFLYDSTPSSVQHNVSHKVIIGSRKSSFQRECPWADTTAVS